MTKITIFSGFLGAGKTTLIKKLIADGFGGEKLVLIENEFGEIGVDGGFMKDAGIEVTEMNSGCICCSLVGDFGKALEKVIKEYHPDRILIEPSGVGKLSDVIGAVENVKGDEIEISGLITVADAKKVKVYLKNFGEFYVNQVQNASAIVLSRTADISDDKLAEAVDLLRGLTKDAVIITTPWDELTGAQIIEAAERKNSLEAALAEAKKELAEEHHHHHHHHHGEDDDEHEHGEHHHGEDDEHGEHEHHHHHEHEEHDEHDHEHHHHDHEHDHKHHHHDHDEHEHHYDENGVCSCGHHHDHDADEVFQSFGAETVRKTSKKELESCLKALDSGDYGTVLRAKGILPAEDGTWLHFDYVPEEYEVRTGSAEITGRLCVIGSDLNEPQLKQLFNVE